MSVYHVEYNAEHKILAVRFTGDFTEDVFKEFYATAPSYLQAREVRAAIVDFRGLAHFSVSPAVIRELAYLAPLVPDSLPRFVIAPQDVTFAMARMFQMSTSRREGLHVVRTEADAYRALGVTPPLAFERLP